MTALPARCRKINDAPRVPTSTIWRVRRSRAEWPTASARKASARTALACCGFRGPRAGRTDCDRRVRPGAARLIWEHPPVVRHPRLTAPEQVTPEPTLRRVSGTGNWAGTGTGKPPIGIGTSAGAGAVTGAAGAGSPGICIVARDLPDDLTPGIAGSCGTVCGRCWPPTVAEPSGALSSASGPEPAGAGRPPGTGCSRTGTSGASTDGFGGGVGPSSGSTAFSGGG